MKEVSVDAKTVIVYAYCDDHDLKFEVFDHAHSFLHGNRWVYRCPHGCKFAASIKYPTVRTKAVEE